MSDLRGRLRRDRWFRFWVSLSLLLYAAPMVAFWSLRLYHDYYGSKPPFPLEVELLGIAAAGSVLQIGLIAMVLRKSVTRGVAATFVAVGVGLAILFFAAIWLIGQKLN